MKMNDKEGEETTESGPSSTWAELTHECLINILSRLTLEQRWMGPMFVCKSWFLAGKDPFLNSVFDLETHFDSPTESPRWWIPEFERKVDSMLRSVIEWSDGSLTEIKTRHCSDSALNFAAERILKEALSNALVPFYPIAGRLGWNESGRLEISCNAEGVLFLMAETDSVIDDLGDFTPSSQLQQLVPAVDYMKDITSHPLLLLQVTYFKCGGACLGVGFHHTLADGTSTLQFINTWADMARGFPMTSTPLIHRTIFHARVPPSPSFHHTEYDPPLSTNNPTQINEFQSSPVPTSVATLKLSLDQINTLKASVKKDHLGTDVNYSTYEVLAAHIWRCMCRARKLPSTQASKFYISMSGRSRLNPPIPSTYFGNVIFFTTPIALSGDIQSEQLIFTVERIRKAVKQMDNKYLTSALAYLRQHHDVTTLRHGPHNCKSPNLKLVSWVNLPLYDADFGWGRPVSMGLANIIIGGISFILPSSTGDGSLSLVVCLETHQMELFKKFFCEFQLALRGKM